MIDLLISGLGLLFPGAGLLGVAGVLFKALGKFLPGVASSVVSNPIGAVLSKFAEGFVDIITWAIKGAVGYVGRVLAEGLDHIQKSVPAFIVVMGVAWGSYQYGLWHSPGPTSPPAAATSPAKANPKTSATKTQPKAEPVGWWESILR